MKEKLFFLVIIFGFFIVSVNAETSNIHKESSHPTEDVKKLGKFLAHIEDDLGYVGIRLLGFDEGRGRALTAIQITKEEYDHIRTVEISEDEEGAILLFRTYRDCNLTDRSTGGGLVDKIITVDGQRIQASYVCANTPGQSPQTQELFFIKTPEGQKFTQRKFSDRNYVFVNLGNDLEVPFSTKGFSDIWERTNQPAL